MNEAEHKIGVVGAARVDVGNALGIAHHVDRSRNTLQYDTAIDLRQGGVAIP